MMKLSQYPPLSFPLPGVGQGGRYTYNQIRKKLKYYLVVLIAQCFARFVCPSSSSRNRFECFRGIKRCSLLSMQYSWKTSNIIDVSERFPCVIRRLMTCPSNMPLSIGGIRDIMSDYLVDDIFIRVFLCYVQRHNIYVGS